MKFKEGDKKSKRKTGKRSDDNGVREARDDRRSFMLGTSDGARWRSLACGRMTFEFWTLVFKLSSSSSSSVGRRCYCHVYYSQPTVFRHLCVSTLDIPICCRHVWVPIQWVYATCKVFDANNFPWKRPSHWHPSYPHVSHGDWMPPRVGFLHAFQK
jgi:hypothetical protein